MKRKLRTKVHVYLKTHALTGKQYLGHTAEPDPHAYKGSGADWKAHVRRYGYNAVTTKILKTFILETQALALHKYCLAMSDKLNIVEDKNFLNRRRETGINGGRHTAASKRKISRANTGRHFTHSAITRARMSAAAKNRTPTQRAAAALRQTGKIHNGAAKHKMSVAAKARKKTMCPHCTGVYDSSSYARFHGNNCSRR